MNVTASSKKIQDDKIRLDIEFPPRELEKHLDLLAEEYATKVKLPGFRQGKVPLNIIKTRFKDTLQTEALEKLLPEVITQAVKQESLDVYGPPTLNLDKDGKSPFDLPVADSLQASKPIQFSVNFFLPPEAKIKSVSSVILRDHKIEISTDELEAEIERETLPFTKLEAVNDTIQYKDLIKADITFQDTAFEKYTLTEHNFMYASSEGGARPAYLNDLKASILTMSTDMTRKVAITFTAASEEKTLQDVTTEVQIKIRSVKRRGKIVFDATMLENLKVASEAEYRKAVQGRLESLGQRLLEQTHVREILESLRKTGKFRVPTLVLDNYVKHEWEQYQKQLTYYLKQQFQDPRIIEQSLPKTPSEEWLQSAREKGAKAIRDMLSFEELKKLYPSEVDETQLHEHLRELAKQYGKTDVAAFREELTQSGDFSRIKEQLSQEAVWKTIIKKCKHKKGTPQSIKALEALMKAATTA